MALIGTLVMHGTPAALHVRYASTRYSEPVEDVLYWKVVRIQRNAYNMDVPVIGDVVQSSPHTGGLWFVTSRSSGEVSTGTGSTQAAYRESVPFPCPPVRKGLQTRYLDGEWQKLLKSGWVTLPRS